MEKEKQKRLENIFSTLFERIGRKAYFVQ